MCRKLLGSSVLRSRYLCERYREAMAVVLAARWWIDRWSHEREKEKKKEREEGIKRSWSKIKKPMAQRSANVNEAEFLISCNAAAGGVRQDFINSYRDDVSRGPYLLSTKFRIERTVFVFDSNVHICLLFSTFHLSSILREYINFNVAKVLDLYHLLVTYQYLQYEKRKRNEILRSS